MSMKSRVKLKTERIRRPDMDKHVAKIQLIGYKIDEINFQSNNDYIGSDQPLGLEVDFNAAINVISEENLAGVSLECTVNKEYLSNNEPFYLKIVILGSFSYKTDLGEKELEKLLTTNALAIIFPYLRQLLVQLPLTAEEFLLLFYLLLILLNLLRRRVTQLLNPIGNSNKQTET